MKGKITSAKTWLVVLGVLCIAFLVYDFTAGPGWTLGGGDDLTTTGDTQGNDLNIPDDANNGEANQDIDGSGETPASADEYYFQYQTEKEQARSQEIALLKEIIDNPNATAEGRQEAESRTVAITKRIEDESTIVALLAAKNFNQSAAFIQDDQVTVVVTGTLDAAEAQQIADIVDGVTSVGVDNVVIINKE